MGRPPIVARLAAIRRSIARQDYRILRVDGNERFLLGYCRSNGLDACELMRSWAAGENEAARAEKPQRAMDDLGPPPTEDVPDDDDDLDDGEDEDDSEQQRETTSPVCSGLGRGKDGATCARCGGTGRVPIGPEDTDDDDDDELKKETYRYEYELEE
jgi:hypothetical protein